MVIRLCGYHFVRYINTESQSCIPEINMSIISKNKIFKNVIYTSEINPVTETDKEIVKSHVVTH